MRMDDEEIRVEAGMAVRIPAGVEHSFQATGTEPVEIVQVYSPAGPEQRFRQWEAIPSGKEETP